MRVMVRVRVQGEDAGEGEGREIGLHPCLRLGLCTTRSYQRSLDSLENPLLRILPY